MTIFLFIAGLCLLIGGAEVLVRGASRLALLLGISPLVVGLTVVAYATGSPELAVGIRSTLAGQPDLAIGNVVGSNTFNILLILGVSAVILPLAVSRRIVRVEVPLMILASVVAFGFALDGVVSKVEGIILTGLSLLYTWFVIFQGRRASGHAQESADTFVSDRTTTTQGLGAIALNLGFIVVGLALLVLGARWLVDGAVTFARYLKVSETVIGLTIVAAGTGLPEVATSVIAGLRGEREIAIGNVVGSNVFNLLVVLGVSALVAPTAMNVPPQVIGFDLPVMLAAAVACFPIFLRGYEIARWEGCLFLAYYGFYIGFLVMKALNSSSLPAFEGVVLWIVIPLTVVTFGVIFVRGMRLRPASSTGDQK